MANEPFVAGTAVATMQSVTGFLVGSPYGEQFSVFWGYASSILNWLKTGDTDCPIDYLDFVAEQEGDLKRLSVGFTHSLEDFRYKPELVPHRPKAGDAISKEEQVQLEQCFERYTGLYHDYVVQQVFWHCLQSRQLNMDERTWMIAEEFPTADHLVVTRKVTAEEQEFRKGVTSTGPVGYGLVCHSGATGRWPSHDELDLGAVGSGVPGELLPGVYPHLYGARESEAYPDYVMSRWAQYMTGLSQRRPDTEPHRAGLWKLLQAVFRLAFKKVQDEHRVSLSVGIVAGKSTGSKGVGSGKGTGKGKGKAGAKGKSGNWNPLC